jgi:hypothetical protein
MSIGDLVFIIFIFFIGFHAGELMLGLRIREAVRRAAKKEGIELEEDEKSTVRKLIVEKENHALFLYDFDNKSFICQGKTVEELAVKAKEYKSIEFAAVLHDKECLFFVDGIVKSSL